MIAGGGVGVAASSSASPSKAPKEDSDVRECTRERARAWAEYGSSVGELPVEDMLPRR